MPGFFAALDGDFYVTQCSPSESNYLRWKLCGINDHFVKTIYEKMSGFVSKKNEYSLDIGTEMALPSADVLKYLEIIEEEETFSSDL